MVEEKGSRLRRGSVYSLTEDQSRFRPVDELFHSSVLVITLNDRLP